MLCPDLTQLSRVTAKIIKSAIVSLYKIWIERCGITHTTVVDGVQIEEIIELTNEIEHVKITTEVSDARF